MRFNYYQPIRLDYSSDLTDGVNGYIMEFPNLEKFNLHYGEPEENAPTNSLLDTIRLLLPQIRVINSLRVDGNPNPAAFLAYEKIEPKILQLIFQVWVQVCYPESEHEALKPFYDSSQFCWESATSQDLKYWAPSWAVAYELSQYKYEWGGHELDFLFGPGRAGNVVELVSWPPLKNAHGYRTSIFLIVSTQSDLRSKCINLHLGMKRWVVKQGKDGVHLEKGKTGCYVRRLTSWLGDYNLLKSNAFTTLKANYRYEDNQFIPQWHNQNKQSVTDILRKLAVEIPEIATVLQDPLKFLETEKMDILIPARGYQKVGWGTGLPFSDERKLLGQILQVLPPGVKLVSPWKKIPLTGDLNKSIETRFQEVPKISGSRPNQKNKFPNVTKEFQEFLQEIARNLKTSIPVYYMSEEVKKALQEIAQHYFGDSLTLKFHPSSGLAEPLEEEKGKRRTRIKDQHIQKVGEQHSHTQLTPAIIEILSPKHPSYRKGKDPKSYLKSQLPKYKLIPQCILSIDLGTDSETGKPKIDPDLKKSLYSRAFASILDALIPFHRNYPLSKSGDNTVYAGFYIIRRNNKTADKAFSEPVLVVIYQNKIDVLLPKIDLKFRSMSDAIVELANHSRSNNQSQKTVNNILTTLSKEYSKAEDIYLFVHSQNARQYWEWLQDSHFDPEDPPSRKIHIIRIRDRDGYEAPEGYGLPTEEEIFDPEIASFAQGIFIPSNWNPEDFTKDFKFTQTVLSVSQKPDTNQTAKNLSRVAPWTSQGYEDETDEAGNILKDEEGKNIKKINPDTGKRIRTNILNNPSSIKDWDDPQGRIQNILATPSPEQFLLHHAIAHHLRSCHWWTPNDAKYPLPLSLAEKLKEWVFYDPESEDNSEN